MMNFEDEHSGQVGRLGCLKSEKSVGRVVFLDFGVVFLVIKVIILINI